MKTQNILAAAAGLAVGYMAFREKSGAVGYTGPATLRKTLNHLAKAENHIWESGSGWTLTRDEQLQLGEARSILMQVIENNGYQVLEGGRIVKA